MPGGAPLKRVESLEKELGHLNDRLETQGHQIQFQGDSIVSMQLKMDQKIEEVLKAIAKGKNPAEESKEDELLSSGIETPRGTGTGSSHDGGGGGGRGMGEPGGGLNWRFRKLDMPLFDGEHPDGWILRVERYFNFYKLSEADKMEAAVVALEGDALLWFQLEHTQRPVTRWQEMKSLLLRQFRPVNACTLHQQWLALTQSGSVLEYHWSFIELLAPYGPIHQWAEG
ncbi:unnamed protein product [Lactuca virosa]|uniref:Retrotransposon gag domain-containing protein n=1 Tax=Lactuca virosa TaxID=75947 RepID=A0AAU9NW31_9ASTR|nr:unnamed protein product [Lactuca virosa]